jgi:hypothetical protein
MSGTLAKTLKIMGIVTLIAVYLLTAVGCSAPSPNYVYIDKNCTKFDEAIKVEWKPVRWVVIHTEGISYYATPDGETLLMNLAVMRGKNGQ